MVVCGYFNLRKLIKYHAVIDVVKCNSYINEIVENGSLQLIIVATVN